MSLFPLHNRRKDVELRVRDLVGIDQQLPPSPSSPMGDAVNTYHLIDKIAENWLLQLRNTELEQLLAEARRNASELQTLARNMGLLIERLQSENRRLRSQNYWLRGNGAEPYEYNQHRRYPGPSDN